MTVSRRTFLGAGAGALSLPVLTGSLGPARAAARARATPWDALASRLRGTLVRPGDAAYEQAKQLDLGQFDAARPQAVAYCQSPADVSLCLRFAQDNGVPLTPRSGGHSLGGYSTTQGLIVDVSRLNAVTPGEGTVRFGAGAQNIDLLTGLAPHGRAVVGGAHATVAAGGYVQGGGVGFLTRRLGMACDAMTSAEVVLADGRVVTASRRRHPELFWALRGGGGGNFGVVTSYTATTAQVGTVAAATLAWRFDDAADLLDGYTRWLVDAPSSIGGIVLVFLPDAAPGTPPVVAQQLVGTGGPEQLTAEVDRMLSLVGRAPQSNRVAELPYRDLMMNIYGCATLSTDQCRRVGTRPDARLPRTPFGLARSRLFRGPIPRAAWDRALAVFDTARVPGQRHQMEVLALGGAANAPGRTDTAYVHRDSLFNIQYVTPVFQPTDEGRAAARAWVDTGFEAIDPHSSRESYQNFIDPALPGWQRAYYAENYPRLSRIKHAYDPHGVFRFAQGIR
ncbi:FAD-binding oxidoreductase [Actinomadura litoris]|uniref:FAD-binding protein n=1 Tax=Actinomadura litoris TaxID=2678616 RepID=A0A7K1KSK9_9ACTN|nr:FAD-binding oxidoreductase [Actinomadura litoris]MUN35171.1 FAD-binding protein [Actinomadura litoris]